MDDGADTCIVFLLGYPGVGKRTVGSHLTQRLDGVLVDNQLIHIPLLTLFKWDGKVLLPTEIWRRADRIREVLLGTIEDLAPKSNSYVFTNVLEDDEDGASQYDRIRSLAHRRGSLFLSVMVDCDVDEEVRRIENLDRIARLKGSDPEGYRRYRRDTKLFNRPQTRSFTSTRRTSGRRKTPSRSTRCSAVEGSGRRARDRTCRHRRLRAARTNDGSELVRVSQNSRRASTVR